MSSGATNRKRQRPPRWGNQGLSLLLFAFSLTQSNAFSALCKSAIRGESYVDTAPEQEGTQFRRKRDEVLERLLSLEVPNRGKDDYREVHQSSSYPLWLQRYYEDEELEVGVSTRSPLEKLQDLEALLTKNGFSSEDNQDILQTMFYYYAPSAATAHTSASATSLLMGMIDFVHLIVAEHGHFQSLEPIEAEDEENRIAPMHCDMFASKPVILAGIVHYAECVAARQNGMFDRVEQSLLTNRISLLAQPFSTDNSRSRKSLSAAGQLRDSVQKPKALTWSKDRRRSSPKSSSYDNRFPPNLSNTARKIAESAATIKSAEILARTIMGVGTTRRLSKAEAAGLQGLLLSSMEDWRALALRCIASLFRLEGILHQRQKPIKEDQSPQLEGELAPLLPGLRSPEVVHTAQEAILVYGTLAQRLGMHQLKAKIEEKAFQILYQRQYKAVSSVYEQNGSAMQVIRSHLSTEIDALLRSDDSLMAHIESLEVSSRVKEPYSFWKKLLKTKTKQKRKLMLPGSSSSSGEDAGSKKASDLSFAQVQDGIALRVILKAKKENPEESDETTRARERLLCYYVQHLIRKQWPGDDDRVKDYIQYPKPNGYQSLHYTAWLTYYTGQHFPFEVQVRSEEMHRIAEYGVAAHWDYKLASSTSTSTGAQNEAIQQRAAFALKAADDVKNVHMLQEVSVAANEFDRMLSVEGSPPSPNGNSLLPREIMNSEAAAKYESLLLIDGSAGNGKGKDDQTGYIDALVTARQTLVQQRVYVFVAGSSSLTWEQGQLLMLDSESSIRDALEYIRKETPQILEQPVLEVPVLDAIGNVSTTAKTAVHSSEFVEPSIWRNGQRARMDDIIRNGDVLLFEL